VHFARGLSNFSIVGLPDGTIKESRERITAAISNSGYAFPIKRITTLLKLTYRNNSRLKGDNQIFR